MDELFGLIADAIAKKLREANMTVAEAQQRAIVRASGAAVPVAGRPGFLPAPPPTASPAAVTPRILPSAGSIARQAAADSAALDSLFTPGAASVAARRERSALLAAFGGGEPLVAAFVLSEALAPPVALREPRW